ncbi:hypothetical protein [Brevibacterium oceani]|uniref:hypothetical protein n=1 Tax=Brevibacterium oceani TaxID=358099 RepID=UPI0015E73D17|nr:hypothetical protein [Brevibacterium oceani]
MTDRVDRARRIAAEVDQLDDAQLRALVDNARTVGVGIGGTTKVGTINGEPVFIKYLPVPRSEENDPYSTVDRLSLPFVSHYGIGSLGHGVGRELAAHRMTSEWVQTGKADFFPLLFGSRILDLHCDIDLSEFDGEGPRRQWGPYWHQLTKNLQELKSATAGVVLLLEYVPETLGAQLRRRIGDGAGEPVVADAVHQIVEATEWMNAEGFHHFDVHPGNTLVHEGRLLFTDFGLSLHHEFELTVDEKASLPVHAGFDRDSGLMHLFHWVLFELGFTSEPERMALLRAASQSNAPELEPVRTALGESADLISHYAEVAVDMTEMFSVLMEDVSAASYSYGQAH